METLVGFAVGFLVGAKEGREGLAKICQAWTAIKESGEVKTLLGGAVALALPIARDLAKAVRA
ncbi:MAG TPA: hypothetical protein VHV82_11880 [Sporichthyaceae bacterium]|jgi:hypothetical protein|nr:hypothetical protein [Sporichthyaceae bacterium]